VHGSVEFAGERAETVQVLGGMLLRNRFVCMLLCERCLQGFIPSRVPGGAASWICS
jgi:hypothetical protein